MGLFIWKSLRLAISGLAPSAEDWALFCMFGINRQRIDAFQVDPLKIHSDLYD
jgi:hypothetical protein